MKRQRFQQRVEHLVRATGGMVSGSKLEDWTHAGHYEQVRICRNNARQRSRIHCLPMLVYLREEHGQARMSLDNGAARLHYGRGLQAIVMDPPLNDTSFREILTPLPRLKLRLHRNYSIKLMLA